MRKLASVQKIKSIEPIDGADRIELAHVLGWQCVVKKGEFKEGDYCVYFEIDSFLPIRPEFEFLRASSYKNSELLGEGFRLRTQTMRGQISQGLCLRADLFPELWIDPLEQMPCVVPSEGQDVTDLLGVRKWEIPEMATTGGTVVGQLPYDIPHTDETRIQAEPELLDEFKNVPYYISTKMDGSSHSIGFDENGIHVTGHNYEYKDDEKSSFYNFVKKRGFLDSLEKYRKDYPNIRSLTIQGEYCGPGIQKNRLKLQKPEWYVFDIRINGARTPMTFMKETAEKLNMTIVPIEEMGLSLPDAYPTIDDLLKRADGEYPNGGKKEGIVVRPITPQFSKILNTDLSMKVINNKYLLKHKED